MEKFFFTFLTALLSACSLFSNEKDYPYQSLYENLPFEMPKLEKPRFPNYKVNITEYGGVPDGIALNTKAFAKAIDALSSKGGGTLVIPSGVWNTGPIVLQSNIELHLEMGALILFTDDKNAYPLQSTFFEGSKAYRAQSPISGRNLTNIAITGQGAINGSGDAWRPLKRVKVTNGQWNATVKSGGVLKGDNLWFPSESALKGDSLLSFHRKNMTIEDYKTIKDYLRPVMISLVECKNVLLEGVLFENSPSWNIHPLMCENLIIDGIFVRNPSYAQNGDGIDIESCKNVIVVNSTLDVGDDGICLKSGKDEQGRKRNRPTENVVVDNCRVFKGHGGFVVGSEMSGGIRNISVSNCQFIGTDVGLRFKSARGRGGVVEHIYINNINMFNIVNEPISFNLYYFTKKTDDVVVADETTPQFKNIHINDVVAKNAEKAMSFVGLPEMNIEGIYLENVIISSKLGAELSDTREIKFKDTGIYPEEGPALMLNDVKDVEIENFSTSENNSEVVKIQGTRNDNIKLPENMDKNKIFR